MERLRGVMDGYDLARMILSYAPQVLDFMEELSKDEAIKDIVTKAANDPPSCPDHSKKSKTY